MNSSEINLDLGTVTMQCTAPEVARIFAGLLREMRRIIPKLRSDEVEILRQIMFQENGTVTVAQLFPDFTRESEAHFTLRRLRAAQFIRPAKTGRWEPEEPIEVKPFARLMWDHIGEEEIFASQREAHQEPPTTNPQPPEQSAVNWDDDILDLRDYGESQFPANA